MSTAHRFTNALIHEQSPYLLQHAHNPVDWMPWGKAAFLKARTENKPIFLSIGYSTCHWCHVMERESFENEAIANILNEHFVSIKVDREERPDVDAVYMNCVQMLTGSGGWPMTVFMTPDCRPFFGGTYFPPAAAFGRPGFGEIATELARLWREEPDAIELSAKNLTTLLRDHARIDSGDAEEPAALAEHAMRMLAGRFDATHGGFGGAPKFPSPHNLLFLLEYWRRSGDASALSMVEVTLRRMADGGIHDHLGGGFSRYSVDARWLVPHFEKMLYDQAMLARAYVAAWRAVKQPVYEAIARDILDYVLRDMTHPDGGFYSAEDADSEGEEGRFYVWKPVEIAAVLGADAALFCEFYEVTEKGNFEHGASILNIPVGRALDAFARQRNLDPAGFAARLARQRAALFAAREKRVHPHKDDKVIAAWNGLMISAFAEAGRAFGEPRYVQAAERAADFVLSRLLDRRGRLLRAYRGQASASPAVLEDYACMTVGLLDLYATTFDVARLRRAVEFGRDMLELFWDDTSGGFWLAGGDAETLIAPTREIYDGAYPSGNSIAAHALVRLARVTADPEWSSRLAAMRRTFAKTLREMPAGYTHMIAAQWADAVPAREIVIAGDPASAAVRDMLAAVNEADLPDTIVLLNPLGEAGAALAKLAPWTAAQGAREGQPTFYLCENRACQLPLTEPADVRRALADAARRLKR